MGKYAVLFMAGNLALTGCRSIHDSEKSPGGAPSGEVSTVAWSVVGTWYSTNPSWNPTILKLSQDGRFYFGQKDAGHWTLTGLQDRVILVLAWRRWPADTLTMMGPDDFRGKVHNGEFVMHRVESQPKESW